MQKLGSEELELELGNLPEWSLKGGKIARDWKFRDFVTAMDFVNRVAALSEKRGHHPDIDIRYNRVTLGLVTHDANGITKNDTSMCAFLDENL